MSTKANVRRFEEDVVRTGSYVYTSERLSSRLANQRISECIAAAFDFQDSTVLDIGCGDGSYTLELAALGARKVIGIDPAGAAIEAATKKAQEQGLSDNVQFEVGDIYGVGSLLADTQFDCIVLRGVLHHLPDPRGAIKGLAGFDGEIVLMEPNGNNPIVKLLERFSRYHIEHEERSFSPRKVCGWLEAAGFRVRIVRIVNLVPFFCPDWAARSLRRMQPIVERVPLVRDIACGQMIIAARGSG